MQVRILKRRYSSSRRPYARRWMTRTLLTLEGRRSLKLLLAANRRLNTAYLLKESFGQLWDYTREGWSRCFFEN